jgi:hypothetical protein
MKIFKSGKEQQPSFSTEERESFMQGWRIGFPVKDDPQTMPTPSDADKNPQFQRGLQEGKDAFKRGGSVLW